MPVAAAHLDSAVAIARAYGATRVILFGSALEAPETARDLDLAVEGIPDWSFFGLAAELASALPMPVDVIPLDQVSQNHFTRCVRRRGRVLFEQDRISHAPEQVDGDRWTIIATAGGASGPPARRKRRGAPHG